MSSDAISRTDANNTATAIHFFNTLSLNIKSPILSAFNITINIHPVQSSVEPNQGIINFKKKQNLGYNEHPTWIQLDYLQNHDEIGILYYQSI